MKNLILFTIVIIFTFSSNLSFCQQDNGDKQIIQFATGKDKITFTVLDFETNEPLIGAAIYSFNLKKILANTDIDGVAITEKELKGNLEISYIAYDPHCFRLIENSTDSVIVWLQPAQLDYGYPVIDPTQKTESASINAESAAKLDLNKGKIQLLTTVKPSEEQILFAKQHSFVFKVYERNKHYIVTYNEVIINFLNNKFEKNIEEELREICWRIYQP
jgi:hypothetical protein